MGCPAASGCAFNVGATVYASFSISTHYGSISGSGSGELGGTGIWASFAGTMTVTHGTGRYSHAHGHGGFYGVIDRRQLRLDRPDHRHARLLRAWLDGAPRS